MIEAETLELTERKPAQGQKFKDAYTTRCNGCSSMLMLQHPFVHCPNCHHVWRARRMSQPVRCVACDFNLFNWRKLNQIPDRTNAATLLA